MEPVSENNKEKVKANTQAVVADKNKATKEPEVTDAEKKVKFSIITLHLFSYTIFTFLKKNRMKFVYIR